MRIYNYRLGDVSYGDGLKSILANDRDEADKIFKDNTLDHGRWELEDIIELNEPGVIAEMIYEE